MEIHQIFCYIKLSTNIHMERNFKHQLPANQNYLWINPNIRNHLNIQMVRHSIILRKNPRKNQLNWIDEQKMFCCYKGSMELSTQIELRQKCVLQFKSILWFDVRFLFRFIFNLMIFFSIFFCLCFFFLILFLFVLGSFVLFFLISWLKI